MQLAIKLTLAALAAGAIGQTAHGRELQAYAGVVAGIAQGSGGPFACATSGPTIGNGWFAGVSLPTEGFAGCNLGGGIDNRSALSGPLLAAQTGNGAVSGGSYSGSARARAGYWSLGVQADGTMTGATSPFTYHQSAAFARFADTLTLSAPGIATGTAGVIDFSFLIHGALSSLPNPPYTQQGDVALGIRVNGKPEGIWYAFNGTVINDGLPYVRGGASGLPGDLVLAPGSLSGSTSVRSTAGFAFQWGMPFDVEVALLVSVYPCCNGTTVSADYLHTAQLDGIRAGTAGGWVDGFTVVAESGATLGPQGLAPIPEPSAAALMLSGLAWLATLVGRRRP
ncbi:MAG: hypothetical protein ACOZD0_03705 [Pseudomonadota bacterium]